MEESLTLDQKRPKRMRFSSDLQGRRLVFGERLRFWCFPREQVEERAFARPLSHPAPESKNFIGILFLFVIMIYPRLRRVHCQDIGEFIKAKSGEKN